MKEDVGRPEELMINGYLKILTATGNIVSALGFLALLWSTVVLLGGFVGDLLVKEFWVLTALSFLMAFRFVEVLNREIGKGHYMEETWIIPILQQQKWVEAHMVIIVLRVVSVVKGIFVIGFAAAFSASPYVNLGVSVWRLVRRDYGDASGDSTNRTKLNAALDIFYALILFQSLFALYFLVTFGMDDRLKSETEKHCGQEEWASNVVWMYSSQTKRKFYKDGDLPNNWNLITYGIELLRSASGEDHLWGARVLDSLFDKDTSVRQRLLSSRLSIQNLIGMIGWRGTDDNIENRERAARIVAYVASDLLITHFPGTLECICSLLESYKQSSEPQITFASEDNSDEQSRPDPEKKDPHGSMETSKNQDDAHMVVPIKDNQSGDEHEQVANSSSAGFAKRKIAAFFQRLKKEREMMGVSNPTYHHHYESRGTKQLISQGLTILERLTQDEVNCAEIIKHQLLLSKITTPLSSLDFLTQDEMLSKSLTVLKRLLRIPGDGATRLRQELASNTEAVSNLMGILETDSEGAQQLHGQAVEILTEIALASFTKPPFGESIFMLNKLCENLEIFLEEKVGETRVADETDREKALRLSRVRVEARDALQRLLPFQSASIVKAAAKIPKRDAIDRLTKLVDKTLSGKTGTTADAATRAGSGTSCAIQEVGSQPLEEADSVQPPTQRNEEPSEERDVNIISKQQAFMEDMLFVAAAMSIVNVISKQDFTRPSPEDEALAKKLMEILEVNKRSTTEFFRILKVTFQVVIPMIQAVPSCIKFLNEQNFKEALTEILETMNGHELPRFQAARVKEMKERLA